MRQTNSKVPLLVRLYQLQRVNQHVMIQSIAGNGNRRQAAIFVEDCERDMPLLSDLFSKPAPDPRLEQCAVRDSAHLTKGVRGEAVARVQKALIALDQAKITDGELKDKTYGTSTARAVLAYKSNRNIINTDYQKSADDVVGKMTISRLDEEMRALESSKPTQSAYICADPYGCQLHDHSSCRRHARNGLESEIEVAPDGTMSHFGTPRNPLRSGKMVCIGGAWEAEYLGFENYVPDPLQDPSMSMGMVNGRPFTHRLRNQSVSDICFRSAPLDRFMRWEIPRICMHGARLTYVSDEPNVRRLMRYFSAIGRVIESGTITETKPSGSNGSLTQSSRRYAVTTVLRINPWLDPNFLSRF